MSGQWKQGLFNCLGDCQICLCGTFCTPCLICQNAEHLGKSRLIYLLLGCVMPCIPTLLLRSEAREKYGIEGTSLGDFVAAFLCTDCANCQTAVEIKEHGDDK